MSDGEGHNNEVIKPDKSSKKRKRFGRMVDVNKKIRLQSHELGEDCKCTKYKCFELVSDEQKLRILTNFNLMPTRDAQNAYLCGLISIMEVQRRRPRKEEEEANLHSASYAYRVRLLMGDKETLDMPVCFKAFLSLHGIGRQRLATLKKSLLTTGNAPLDKRGKHDNRPNKLTQETKKMVMDHIRSFRGRKSHYSLHDSSKIYLPEELSITKMFEKFNAMHKDVISYETYRTIFNNDFNISFGYPRSDTCSTCDEFKAKIAAIDVDMKEASSAEEKIAIEARKKQFEIENKLHKVKADVLKFFYENK